MKVLFLTIGEFGSIRQHEIYPDLIRCLRDHGHEVYVVASHERRKKKPTTKTIEDGVNILRVRIGNITGSGLIEKGISTILIEYQYLRGIKKYYRDITFDLVLYHTPPITLGNVIRYIKKRDNAKSYLMLKDIFPQNAVDLEMMTTCGPKALLYTYFCRKEEQLYRISDYIGCMSEANRQYLLDHHTWLEAGRVEICPNCLEIINSPLMDSEKAEIKRKYNIPLDRTVFVYGGNLGKPQGISFLIECLKSQVNQEKAFFLIIGSGTEYKRLEQYLSLSKQRNVKLMSKLPTNEYRKLVDACDVGMVYLDHRFTIPNFPSRILPYMEAGLPVLAVTDPVTDIGKEICKGGFGWWCESNDITSFSEQINIIISQDLEKFRSAAYRYLKEHYDVRIAYQAVMSHFE